MNKEKERQWFSVARSWAWTLFVALLIATSFRSAVADWNDVPTGSMKPTIVEGDRIFVNKLAYDLKIPYTTFHLSRWGDPLRGDIVVFFSPADGQRLVKRVIGLPGDTIALVRNRLIVNGTLAQYQPLPPCEESTVENPSSFSCRAMQERLEGNEHAIRIFPGQPAMNTFGPIEIPQGEYFMMGDNRDRSADSRYFGFVKRERIVGRATRVIFSLNRDHYYIPRKGRFFKRLS
jgi:signal peptidase I